MVVITDANIQNLVAAFVSVREENDGDVIDDDEYLGSWFQDMLDGNLDVEALKFVISTPIGRWDVSRVTDMWGLFSDMPFDFDDAEYYHVNDDLTRGDQVDFEDTDTEYEKFLNTWNVSNVTTMRSMFSGCKNLRNIFSLSHDIEWDTTKLTETDSMFENCESYLGGVELETFNMENVTNANGMFYGCSDFNSDLSNWNVINLKNADQMFYGCRYFNSDISRWNVRNLKSAKSMFVGCDRFDQDLSSWTFYRGFNSVSLLDPNDYRNEDYLRNRYFDGHSGEFMFSSPMSEQPEKWPRYVNEPAPDPAAAPATGGRRRLRKTKHTRRTKKVRRSRKSRKGRKAGRRTRNAKKYAKKQKVTRRHRRK